MIQDSRSHQKGNCVSTPERCQGELAHYFLTPPPAPRSVEHNPMQKEEKEHQPEAVQIAQAPVPREHVEPAAQNEVPERNVDGDQKGEESWPPSHSSVRDHAHAGGNRQGSEQLPRTHGYMSRAVEGNQSHEREQRSEERR